MIFPPKALRLQVAQGITFTDFCLILSTRRGIHENDRDDESAWEPPFAVDQWPTRTTEAEVAFANESDNGPGMKRMAVQKRIIVSGASIQRGPDPSFEGNTYFLSADLRKSSYLTIKEGKNSVRLLTEINMYTYNCRNFLQGEPWTQKTRH
jgi:hypothetical protein